jgi:DNA-binding CsgD family transcriptional regulator
MNYTEATIPYYIYSEHLGSIQNIKFTFRETEVIAYILHGRSAKRIASNLSITPKTVENYIRNIMLKIGCNSREGIINFIEKTGKYASVRKFYLSLMLQTEFENCLKAAARKISNPGKLHLVVSKRNHEENLVYIQQICKHLELINYQVSLIDQSNKEFIQCLFKLEPLEENTYTLKLLMSEEERNILTDSSFLSQQEHLRQAKTVLVLLTKKREEQELENITEQVSLLHLSHYFVSVFKLLTILRAELNLTHLIQDFQTRSQQLYHSEDEYLPKEKDALISKSDKKTEELP